MTEQNNHTPNHRPLPEADGRLGLTPSELDQTVLIKTSAGEIKPFLLAAEDQRDEKGNRLTYDIVLNKDGNPEVGDIKPVDERAFTAEVQDYLANELANSRPNMPEFVKGKSPRQIQRMEAQLEKDLNREVAINTEEVQEIGEKVLIAAEVAEPVAESPEVELSALDRLTEGLSEDDKIHLRGYAWAKADRKEAHNAGDAKAAGEAKETLDYHYNNMSQKAKDVRDQFAVLS